MYLAPGARSGQGRGGWEGMRRSLPGAQLPCIFLSCCLARRHLAPTGRLTPAALPHNSLSPTQHAEVFAWKPYGYSCDSWSLGCILYELAALQYAFEAPSTRALRFKVRPPPGAAGTFGRAGGEGMPPSWHPAGALTAQDRQRRARKGMPVCVPLHDVACTA